MQHLQTLPSTFVYLGLILLALVVLNTLGRYWFRRWQKIVDDARSVCKDLLKASADLERKSEVLRILQKEQRYITQLHQCPTELPPNFAEQIDQSMRINEERRLARIRAQEQNVEHRRVGDLNNRHDPAVYGPITPPVGLPAAQIITAAQMQEASDKGLVFPPVNISIKKAP